MEHKNQDHKFLQCRLLAKGWESSGIFFLFWKSVIMKEIADYVYPLQHHLTPNVSFIRN